MNEEKEFHKKVLKEYKVSQLVKAIQKQFVKINADFINNDYVILSLKSWAKLYSKCIDKRSPVITDYKRDVIYS